MSLPGREGLKEKKRERKKKDKKGKKNDKICRSQIWLVEEIRAIVVGEPRLEFDNDDALKRLQRQCKKNRMPIASEIGIPYQRAMAMNP